MTPLSRPAGRLLQELAAQHLFQGVAAAPWQAYPGPFQIIAEYIPPVAGHREGPQVLEWPLENVPIAAAMNRPMPVDQDQLPAIRQALDKPVLYRVSKSLVFMPRLLPHLKDAQEFYEKLTR